MMVFGNLASRSLGRLSLKSSKLPLIATLSDAHHQRVNASFSTASTPKSPSKVFTKGESRDFMAIFPDLVRELTLNGPYEKVPVVNKHMTKCIQYNVPTGKKNRGMAVPFTFSCVASDPSAEQMKKACILGWCVEFLQAFFLLADDIMDGSETRRGQTAWYKKEEIGLMAFNDGILLEACVYAILEKHFSQEPYYDEIVKEFHHVTRHTAVGQCLDLITAKPTKEGKPNLDAFDMNMYNAIVKFKTAYYSFVMPVTLGLQMAGINDSSYHNMLTLARNILLEMGHFFQVQDDYLDCYGDPEVTGKIGTDIQDGKCSWLIVVAMQRANKEQKEILRNCYGNPDRVSEVKAVYDDLKVKKIFRNYEDEEYADIVNHINQLPGEGKIIPKEVFTTFLDRINKRDN